MKYLFIYLDFFCCLICVCVRAHLWKVWIRSNSSNIKFKLEKVGKNVNFLDVQEHITSNGIKTEIYTKPTKYQDVRTLRAMEIMSCG